VTYIILAINIILSLIAFNNRELFAKLEFNPYQVYHRKQYYRLFTHAFIHADLLHLFINMYVLYNFGFIVELFFSEQLELQGTYYFILLYMGGVFFSSLPALKRHKDNFHYNAVGASGAIAAVLFSFIIFQPMAGIGILFIPGISIPAIVIGILYLWYERYMDKRSGDRIAHDAHYWGALFGAIFTILVMPRAFLNFFNQIISIF